MLVTETPVSLAVKFTTSFIVDAGFFSGSFFKYVYKRNMTGFLHFSKIYFFVFTKRTSWIIPLQKLIQQYTHMNRTPYSSQKKYPNSKLLNFETNFTMIRKSKPCLPMAYRGGSGLKLPPPKILKN